MKKLVCAVLLLFKLSALAEVYSHEFTKDDKILMDKLVQSWFKCYNKWDLIGLKKLYSEDVIYYGKNLSKEQCINEKLSFFNPKTTFTQKLISEITYLKNKNGIVVAKFIKRAGFNNKLQNYPSYLLIYKRNYSFLIFGEGDDISDEKLNFKLNIDDITIPKNIPTEIQNKENTSFSKWVFGTLILVLIIVFLVIRNLKKTKVNEKEEIISEKTIKTNEIKGKEFEDFIVTKFKKEYFKLLEWRSDKYKDGIYAQSNKKPDLEYEFFLNNKIKKFAVECKYRSKIYDDISVAKQYKIEEYKKHSKENDMPVFIVLGLEGEPSNPKECYIIPIWEIYNETMKYSSLQKFRRYSVDKNFFFNADSSILS